MVVGWDWDGVGENEEEGVGGKAERWRDIMVWSLGGWN